MIIPYLPEKVHRHSGKFPPPPGIFLTESKIRCILYPSRVLPSNPKKRGSLYDSEDCNRKRPQAIGPYSQAAVAGDLLFTSGQIPLDPVTGDMVGSDITEQTEQVMKNLTAVLEAAGTSAENIIKTTCFLADIADFAAFNAVYARYIDSAPARSCVAVKALPKGALVEVECIAKIEGK